MLPALAARKKLVLLSDWKDTEEKHVLNGMVTKILDILVEGITLFLKAMNLTGFDLMLDVSLVYLMKPRFQVIC